ncbi:MAG: fluoride exporter [Solirubrobacteraceae bacterium]|nr:fluoride exporter [Solirubrobacteraceae bacterium]
MAMPAIDRRELGAIFAGGFVGAIARAALAETFTHRANEWPWATFAVNVFGAFLLGYFVTRLQERLPLSSYRRPLLGTGFCGALTTFATMQVELLKMIDTQCWGLAIGYASASVAAGFAAVFVATNLVRRARVAL